MEFLETDFAALELRVLAALQEDNNCTNHTDRPAAFNSIYAGGEPLCTACAISETETAFSPAVGSNG